MRWPVLLICGALAGCRFDLPQVPGGMPDGTPSSDSSPDAGLCYGSGLGKVCLKAVPTTPRMLEGTIDTGIDGMCDEIISVTGANTCVIAGTDVGILSGKTLRAIGTRPLLIVASNILTIAGTLDIGSKRGETAGGPGAKTALCAGVTAAKNDEGGGGGGAGGSFRGAGGDGGSGDLNNNGPPAGPGVGGKHAIPFTPAALIGGCRGGNGGTAATGSTAGTGGLGGGTVYLIAGARIAIPGRVAAYGAGGGAGDAKGGGGGGGSGGMIGLDAPDTLVSGAVTANGGGGGEGGGLGGGNPGADGTMDATRAAGGTAGDVDGGNGGDGSGGTTAADLAGVVGSSNIGGGGGGGGGAGFIYVIGQLTNSGTISPPPTVN